MKRRIPTTVKVRGLFSYPVPLAGCDAVVKVPRDLKRAEAGRIYRVLLSLCVDTLQRRKP